VRNFPSEVCMHSVQWIQAMVGHRELVRLTGLPLSRSTFYRWLENGTIPTRRFVGKVFVARQDLEHFAKESYKP